MALQMRQMEQLYMQMQLSLAGMHTSGLDESKTHATHTRAVKPDPYGNPFTSPASVSGSTGAPATAPSVVSRTPTLFGMSIGSV